MDWTLSRYLPHTFSLSLSYSLPSLLTIISREIATMSSCVPTATTDRRYWSVPASPGPPSYTSSSLISASNKKSKYAVSKWPVYGAVTLFSYGSRILGNKVISFYYGLHELWDQFVTKTYLTSLIVKKTYPIIYI